MKEQYLAQIQNGYCQKDEWWNAKTMMTLKEGRYCKTLEEAQLWIDRAVSKGIELATKRHILGKPPFSIESEPDDKNLITNTRIRKRKVTDWEEV